MLYQNDIVPNVSCQTPRSKITVASSCGEASDSSGNNSSGDQLPHTLHDTTTSSQQPTAYSDTAKVVSVIAPVNVSTEDDVSAENDFEQVVSKKKFGMTMFLLGGVRGRSAP